MEDVGVQTDALCRSIMLLRSVPETFVNWPDCHCAHGCVTDVTENIQIDSSDSFFLSGRAKLFLGINGAR